MARPPVQRLEDILAESDDDDEQVAVSSALRPSSFVASSASALSSASAAGDKADLLSILASSQESDEDSDDDLTATLANKHAAATAAAAAKNATKPVAKPAATATAAKPAAAVNKPAAQPAAAAKPAPAVVAAKPAAAAAAPAVSAPALAAAIAPAPKESASAIAAASAAASTPKPPIVSLQPGVDLQASLADSDTDSEDGTAAKPATAKPAVTATALANAPTALVMPADAAHAHGAAAPVPVSVPRRSFSHAAPTDSDAETVLPPARHAAVRKTSGARASDASPSVPSTPQVPAEKSEEAIKAEKQRARQAAMESMRQHAAVLSKPSSPATTPPRRHSFIQPKENDDEDSTSTAHAAAAPNTAARDPVSSAAAPGPVGGATAPIPVTAASAAPTVAPVASSLSKGGVDLDSDSEDDMAAPIVAAPAASAKELQDILNQAESDEEDESGNGSAGLPNAASAAASNKKGGAATGALSVNLQDDDDDDDVTEDASPSQADASVSSSDKSLAGTASSPTAGGSSSSTPAGGVGGGQMMSEADLMQIRNPLTRAEVLEQNLATLGNNTVLNPLASQVGKARTAQPVPGKGAATGLLVPGSASASANLVRLTGLPNVQAELNRARASIGHAVACCLETNSKFLCVATSKGVVLFFDRGFEKLLMGLGKVDEAASKQRGSITCLDLNVAGDMLLVGYSKGTIAVWDITHRSLVKTIPDASTLPITMLKFTRQDAAAKTWTFLAADTQGCLNLFVLSKAIFSYGVDRTVLLQGKAGPVLASSVLTATPAFPHPADRMALVAIATENFTAVVSLEPQVAIVYRVPREKDERVGVQPCLAWRALQPRDECLMNPAFMASPDGALVTPEEAELARHPTLLMCRGRSMMLLQAVPMTRAEQQASGSKFSWSFRTLASQSMPREIKSCSWLAQGQLIVLILAPTDDILILDPFSPNLLCLATLPGGTIGIVHQEFYFDPDTGRPEQTFTPSIHATDDCLLLLGTDNVSEVKVLPWDKRLDAFVRGDDDNPQWHHCLALSLDLYNGTAIAPFPLPRDRASVQRAMQYKMVELMGNFIAELLQGQSSRSGGGGSGDVDLLTGGRAGGSAAAAKDALRTDSKYVKVLGATCVAFCIAIQRLDILFSDIYDKFKFHFPHSFAHGAGGVPAANSAAALLSGLAFATQSPVSLGSELFLELLEGFILTDQLLTLPVNVLQELFPLYAFKRRLPQLEQMLLHLNPLSLDLNYLIPAIKAYRLFSACIFMYNRGKSTFDLPLSEILGVLTDPANLTAGSSTLSLANAASLLPTPSAPLGPITDAEKTALSYKLLLYVDYCFEGKAFPRKGDLPVEYRPGVRAQVLSVLFRKQVSIADGSITLPEFPYLAYFLNLHTQEFLHILSVVFEGDEEWMLYVENAVPPPASPTDSVASVTSPTAFPGLLGSGSSNAGSPAAAAAGGGGLPASSSFSGMLGFGAKSPAAQEGPPSTTNSSGAHSRTTSSVASLASSFTSLLQQYSPLGDDPAPRHQQQQSFDLHSPSMAPPQPPPSVKQQRLMPQAYLKATGVPSRQQLLDALLYLILDTLQQSPPATSTSHAAMMVPFTYVDRPSHVHALFRFAAKYVARGVVTASKIFSQRIFLYLCSNEGAGITSGARLAQTPTGAGGAATAVSQEKSDRAERQQMLLSLLGRVPDVDADALLSQAASAGFNGVCAVLNIRKGDFARSLDSLLKAIEQNDDTQLPSTLLHAMPPDAPETMALQSVCNKPFVSAIFDFIHESLKNPTLTPQKTAAIRSATLSALPQLVMAHSERTARLVLEDFLSDHDRVVSALSAFPQLQFQYLAAIMTGARNSGDKHGGGSGGADANADAAPPMGRQLSMPELFQRSGLQLTSRMHEQYIQLLCIYAPNDVLAHVSSHHGWELDNVLKLCQQYRIDDAAAFLMEKTHDLTGAMELMLRSVDARLLELRRVIEADWRNFPEPHSPADVPNLSALHIQNATTRRLSSADEPERVVPVPAAVASLVTSPNYLAVDKKLIHSITTASLLCQRHEQDAKVLWFTLLDRFVELQRSMKRIHEGKEKEKSKGKAASNNDADVRAAITASMIQPVYLYMQSALFSYVRLVLSGMMQHLDLASLFAKITTDHQSDSLREFRDTIQGLLDTYSYEQSILTTANALLSSDKFHSVEVLQRRKAAAFQPVSDCCGICARPMSDTAFVAKFMLFDCGHIFHDSCLGKHADSCMLCQRESLSKKRSSSRGTANPSAVAPVTSPTSASSPTSSSGGSATAAIEYVQRLQIAERRFDKGSVRSIDNFNSRLKRFGRGGLDDNTDDEAFGTSSSHARKNPFDHDDDEEDDGGDEPAHGDDDDGYNYGTRSSSVGGRGGRAPSEADEFTFQLPSMRAELANSTRQPGRMTQPVAIKAIDLEREPAIASKK